jgi:hypothetical protein
MRSISSFIDAGWHVANFDARTLEKANVNTVIESQHEFLMAGALGYPISDFLIFFLLQRIFLKHGFWSKSSAIVYLERNFATQKSFPAFI